MKSLADSHYEKASHYYKSREYCCDKLRVLLEGVALLEYQYESKLKITQEIILFFNRMFQLHVYGRLQECECENKMP